MKLNKISTFREEYVQAIIETPKGSPHKYDYDPKLEVFCLNKIMPLGMNFPFDLVLFRELKAGTEIRWTSCY